MTTDLKVPYAIDCDFEIIVKAANASKSSRYKCLECGQNLTLRDGEKRTKHFAHPPTSHAGCSGESLIHKAAKELLARQIRRELEEHDSFSFQRQCPGVEGFGCKKKQLIHGSRGIKGWTQVLLEVVHGDFRLDVAVLAEDSVVYGFEVFYRHQVPEKKAEKLDIRWMELVAEDILSFKPRIPYGYEKSKELCPDCVDLSESLIARENEDRKRDEKTEAYQRQARRCKEVWRSIVEDAKMISREQMSRKK